MYIIPVMPIYPRLHFLGRPLSCKIKGRPFVVVDICLSVCRPSRTAKRCKIGPRLLLITNRKWHTPFQMKWKSLTLDDFQAQWHPVRSAILATAGLLVSSATAVTCTWEVLRVVAYTTDNGCIGVDDGFCALYTVMWQKSLDIMQLPFDQDVVWPHVNEFTYLHCVGLTDSWD